MDAEIAIKELEEAWSQIAATLRTRLLQKAAEIQFLKATIEGMKKDAEEKSSARDPKG